VLVFGRSFVWRDGHVWVGCNGGKYIVNTLSFCRVLCVFLFFVVWFRSLELQVRLAMLSALLTVLFDVSICLSGSFYFTVSLIGMGPTAPKCMIVNGGHGFILGDIEGVFSIE